MNNINSLLWFSVTIACYMLGIFIQKKTNSIFISPPIVAIVLIIGILKIFNISYETYNKGSMIISFFLGLTTIALAVPMYNHRYLIAKNIIAIFCTTIVGFVLSLGLSYIMCDYLNANNQLKLAIMTKSVTTPIALIIANKIGAIPSLCIMFVFSSGIFGAIFGIPLLSIFKSKNEKAYGIALGVVCHGLGVSRAFQVSQICGIFSMLGMALMGIMSGLFIPLLVNFLY